MDPRLTTLAWLGMHNYTYLWLKPGGSVSARQLSKLFADLFIRGVAEPAACTEGVRKARRPQGAA